MKKMLQRGFTLIELLVVIAIIGILAAVVLASLNDARNSGSDAAIKQQMAQVRSQAELFYNSNNFSYDAGTGMCADSEILALLAAIDNNSGGTSTCNDDAQQWAASTPLVSGGNWCVDSTGAAASSTLSGASDYDC